MKTSSTELRKIPGVDSITALAAKQEIFGKTAPAIRTLLAREVLDKVREDVSAGAEFPGTDFIVKELEVRAASLSKMPIQRVINATGIILHTNLGRAPLPKDTLEKLCAICSGYCSVEFDLEGGTRGTRGEWTRFLTNLATGADASLIVNNCAAAVFLVITAFAAQKKEVIISRSELVQIGGGFRIPDIVAQSGAVLKEIGTTNITTLKDYKDAITQQSALILKVHQSNFHIQGHTESPSLKELSQLSKQSNIPLVVDLGSGAFASWNDRNKENEPLVQEVLRGGADLVTFSGDKLLGATQAGFIAGKTALVERAGKHPLFRVLRPEKLILVALEDILLSYLDKTYKEKLPFWQMIEPDENAHLSRVNSFAQMLQSAGVPCVTENGHGAIGGGTSPADLIPSLLITISPSNAEKFSKNLVNGSPPAVVRIDRGKIYVDLRTVFKDEEPSLSRSIISAWKGA